MERDNNNNNVKAYAVLKLLKLIKDIYEEPEITDKRARREQLTKGFIQECINRFGLPKEDIVRMVNEVIEKEKWIQEIEDEDEVILDEGEELE